MLEMRFIEGVIPCLVDIDQLDLCQKIEIPLQDDIVFKLLPIVQEGKKSTCFEKSQDLEHVALSLLSSEELDQLKEGKDECLKLLC